ncbi:AMP-binding protein [Carboxydothermus ferrireducens]|uniref:Acetyl-CoA synthetase/medium-chain acyl-CoA synthetase n=1 Tax=Carboxydothermus ferrireducens DSM 11255 TaxID=1119529 RepID=A0ABX2R7B2_9THEO|nr:AMP-binding protein [Carboxydothermus ferrireducens]NYE56452.1 acetyl-CoA synthetase/medium-chain acyl-CoA synthetase [Carboxydothermus ferrireducens DSM 11255]
MPNMVDYEKTYREFRHQVPEYFNFARDTFDVWAQDPNKLAMLWVDDFGNERRFTFKQFSELSKQTANFFNSLGVKQGDRILVILPRLPEWWVIYLAAIRAGIIFIPGTTQLTSKDIKYRVETAETVMVITDEDNAAKVEEIKGELPVLKHLVIVGKREGWLSLNEEIAKFSPEYEAANTKSDDPAIIFFTSGTTGYPKMAVHTHASYPIGHYITGKYWLDLTPDDLHWNMSDTGWAKAAWSSFFGPWICGAAIFVHHSVGKFDAKKTLELLAKYPITTFCGPPTAYRVFVLEDLKKYKFPHLRHCVAAGEPLNPEVIKVWKEATGLTIRDGYGQTETCVLVANFPCFEVKPGSMGKPAPGYYVSIIDDEGNELPPGKEGNIAIKVKPERPVGLFKEYWKNPDKTAEVFRGDWYLTGDRAIKDEDGYFWFVGRADDVILAAGYRIGPFEVESALVEHPAVAEAAVVASPDEIRGEIVKAFVVLAPGYSPSEELVKELQEHVKKVTAPYKYPREIEFIDALPKTVSGKIRRVELREREWAKKLGKKK